MMETARKPAYLDDTGGSMLTETRIYECACHVCGAATRHEAIFFSSGAYAERAGETGRHYPAYPCHDAAGTILHTADEIYAAYRRPFSNARDLKASAGTVRDYNPDTDRIIEP